MVWSSCNCFGETIIFRKIRKGTVRFRIQLILFFFFFGYLYSLIKYFFFFHTVHRRILRYRDPRTSITSNYGGHESAIYICIEFKEYPEDKVNQTRL